MRDLVIARYRVTDVTPTTEGHDAGWAVSLQRVAPRPGEPVIREPASPWVMYLDTGDVAEGDEFALARVRRADEGDR